MCKAQMATVLVIILHPPHTSRADLKVMEHEWNIVRGLCGLVEAQQ